MSETWICKLQRDSWLAAARLRLLPGIRAALTDEYVWLRGEQMSDQLDLELRKLGGERFTLAADGMLTLLGQRVPIGSLEDLISSPDHGSWREPADLFQPTPQPAAMPGRKPVAISLSIVRGGPERTANILSTTFLAWSAWAQGASNVRLRQLSFAANSEGLVVVRGSPLPPVSGELWVEEESVAVRCGFECQPCLQYRIIARVLGLEAGELAFLHESGDCEVIEGSAFVQARRSAVRLTAAGNGP